MQKKINAMYNEEHLRTTFKGKILTFALNNDFE